MARKYDRYGRNRQFRRNPTRSPKFFPYRLPFQANFSNFRARSIQEDDQDMDGMYDRKTYTQTPEKDVKRKRAEFKQRALKGAKKIARGAYEVGGAMLIAEVPPAAIPIMGLEMVMDPKRYSHIAGGSVIATTAGFGYLSAKNLI